MEHKRKAPQGLFISSFIQVAALVVAVATPAMIALVFASLHFNSDLVVRKGEFTSLAVWATIAMAVLNYYMLSIAGNNVFAAMIRHLVMIASVILGITLVISTIAISTVYGHVLFALVIVNANWIFAGSRVD